jgi:hypothetical protein
MIDPVDEATCFRMSRKEFDVIKTMILTAGFILFFGVMYAVSSLLVGRGDKSHGCGSGHCSSCTLNDENCDTPPGDRKQD